MKNGEDVGAKRGREALHFPLFFMNPIFSDILILRYRPTDILVTGREERGWPEYGE